MAIKQAVPRLRVSDVELSIEWYRDTLGFVGDPFPASPPHNFSSFDTDKRRSCFAGALHRVDQSRGNMIEMCISGWKEAASVNYSLSSAVEAS